MSELNILFEEDSSKGRFYISSDANEMGEITFSKLGNKVIIIDHTTVHKSLEGKGYAKKLVLAVINHARANGLKIVPLCPYAKGVFERDPELKDVL